MALKFYGSVKDLKELLSSLNIQGKWRENINTPTTQIQFKCKNGEILNFYWGTHTVLIQGRRLDNNLPDLLSQIKNYLQ